MDSGSSHKVTFTNSSRTLSRINATGKIWEDVTKKKWEVKKLHKLEF